MNWSRTRGTVATTREVTRVADKLRRRARARLLAALSRSAGWLPQPALESALAGLAGFARWSRFEEIAVANLELAYGPELDGAARARIARGVRRHAARQAAEWIRLGRGAPAGSAVARWIERRVVLDESLAILEAELARGRGALLVTAHLGNWELLAARLAVAGFAGSVVGYERPRDPSHDWLVALRRGYGVGTIAQHEHPRTILRELARGRIVGLLADLEVRRLAGEFVPFFGKPALTITAPAALARASDLPLIPVRCVLSGETYRLSCEEPIAFPRELERAEATRAVCLALNQVFERWIRAAPEQWSWHQPRWRTRPGEIAAIPLAARRKR